MIRIAALVAFLAAPALLQAQGYDTLKKIRDSKTVTVAYRTDALPFSFEKDKQPAGYTVELCKRVIANLEQQLKIQPLQVKWVAATSQNRMDLVKNKQADMECGSTTATFSRMEQVDFSSPVFLDTTGLLVRKASGAASFTALAGKRIAVVGGTSNEKALRTALTKASISANVIVVSTRDDGVNALQAGSVDAFASDKILLIGVAPKVKDPTQYAMLQEDLGFEPYAIVLPRGDAAFRLAVNRALGQIYNSDAIVEIFRGTFGADFSPSPALLVMYGLGTYPD
ncbi:MAG TPA: amino acid ABC transporter substrate-binding protein [Burkholderiales bacterium]|nr:amino acid ABC transporter substrate-binding protein [Burkholderiales bacterium]